MGLVRIIVNVSPNIRFEFDIADPVIVIVMTVRVCAYSGRCVKSVQGVIGVVVSDAVLCIS